MHRQSLADIAEIIKSKVSTAQIADFYGFHLNAAGFINCPFHNGDNTPSLKIYKGNKGWHCFGCGAGSSVIDFVEKMENVSVVEACKRIDDYFDLGLFEHKITRIERTKRQIKRKIADRENIIRSKDLLSAENDYYNALDKVILCEKIINQNEPKNIEDMNQEYIEAVCKLPALKYELDIMKMKWDELCKKT